MALELDEIIFDYRLGYIRAETPLSGFDVIGEEGAPRVLILGGYTTTSQAKSGKSWADCLYKPFKDANNPIQIINGDTDGFTTAQEMLMLIRDGILLEPKLVICLSGFYNFAYKLGFVKQKEYIDILRDYPFTNPGQLDFYKYFTSRFGLGNDKMHYGEKNGLPAWEYWLNHIDIIHGICEEFNIKHISLLQPCMFSDGYKYSETEKNALAASYGLTGDEIESFRNNFRQIYKNAAKGSESRSYITDISNLFDGYGNIYIDPCHVSEEYTNKIAKAVYKKVISYITENEGFK